MGGARRGKGVWEEMGSDEEVGGARLPLLNPR